MHPVTKELMDQAIQYYLAGATSKEVIKKYDISAATLRRHMRKRGLSLSPEEIKIRRQAGGLKSRSDNYSHNQKCQQGCECARHKTRPNRVQVITGKKNCTKCTRFKHLHEYDARERDSEGKAIAWQSLCKTCMRAMARIRVGMARRGKPFSARQFGSKYPDEILKIRRERWAWKKANDPEWLKISQEYDRIYAEAKRREKGIKPRTSKRQNIDGLNGKRLLAAPISFWVQKNINRYENSCSVMARKCQVDEATIRRLNDGLVEYIYEDIADKILINEGSTDMWDIYPDLY